MQTTSRRANSEVIAEDFLEGFRIPIADPYLMRMLNYERYKRPQLHQRLHVNGVAAPGQNRRRPGSTSPARRRDADAGGLTEEFAATGDTCPCTPEHDNQNVCRSGDTLADDPGRIGRSRDVFARYRAPRQQTAHQRSPAPGQTS